MTKMAVAERHGGRILVDQLKIQGVDRVFCVPGESYLAALDGLYDSGIDLVVTRHEGGAAIMAEAHGKITGRPGVAMVTRGPGATNAAAGVHIALQDSTPMILFVGQVASDQRDREAFQEVDYRQFFGPLAKWAAEIDRTDRIPEYLSRAFHVAQSGRPGPVVLALPEDMLSASAAALDAPPARPAQSAPTPEAVDAIRARLRESARPLLLAGGAGWTPGASRDLARLAEAWDLPVAAAFRRQDCLDNRHPNYVGDMGIGPNPDLERMLREADLLLAISPRLGEITTGGYDRLAIPSPEQTLIHVHPGAEEIGRVHHAAIGVACAPGALLSALLAAGPAPETPLPWSPRTRAARASYEAWRAAPAPEAQPGYVCLQRAVQWLSDALPEDAVLTNGAGNYAGWAHRFFQYKTYGAQLAPTSGSMGYGLPAAIAAKLAHPGRVVICFAGDGCFQMTAQEFGVAAEQGAAVIVLVANNGTYGTIRMHQERAYPGRVSGTDLASPDFAALARAYGGYGETVTDADALPAAFDRAQATGKPAILELKTDPAQITATKRL